MCGNIMDDWFGFDPPPAPVQPKAPPNPGIAAQEKVEEELRKNARRRGRLGTIISGGLGDPEFGANVSTPALSGVTYLGR